MDRRRAARVRSVAYSSVIQVLGVSGLSRVLAVARGILVARLLLPNEFGKFALVAAVVGLVETSTNTGLYESLIKRGESSRSSLRAVWTIIVLRGLLVGAALFVLAEQVGGLFGGSEITRLLRVLSLAPVVRALSSLGPVLAQREVDYSSTAKVTITTQMTDVVSSLLLVWMLQSAMGLVIGTVVGALFGTLISYRSPGFTPGFRWRWSEVRPLVSFARWRWVSQIAWYAAAQGDDLVVGGLLGTRPLGLYRLAYTVGNLPTTETATVLVQVTFPALTRAAQRSTEAALDMYRRYVILSSGVASFLAGMLLVLADPLVNALLGEPWAAAAAPLAIISVGGYCRALAASGGALFLAVGRPAMDSIMQVARAGVLFIGLVALLRFGITGAAVASTLSTAAMLPVWISGLAAVGIGRVESLRLVISRIPATLVAVLGAWLVSQSMALPWSSLLVGVLAGVSLWGLATFLFDPPLAAELRQLIRRLRGSH